eukprot:1267318-Amphidinium_carterae.1
MAQLLVASTVERGEGKLRRCSKARVEEPASRRRDVVSETVEETNEVQFRFVWPTDLLITACHLAFASVMELSEWAA